MLEQAMIVELSGVPALAGKIYALAAVNGAKAPYAMYESSYGKRETSLTGYLGARSVKVDLHIVANTYKEMKQITDVVIDLIISWQGRVIGSDGLLIQEVIFPAQPVEIFEELPKLYRCVIEFVTHF